MEFLIDQFYAFPLIFFQRENCVTVDSKMRRATFLTRIGVASLFRRWRRFRVRFQFRVFRKNLDRSSNWKKVNFEIDDFLDIWAHSREVLVPYQHWEAELDTVNSPLDSIETHSHDSRTRSTQPPRKTKCFPMSSSIKGRFDLRTK